MYPNPNGWGASLVGNALAAQSASQAAAAATQPGDQAVPSMLAAHSRFDLPQVGVGILVGLALLIYWDRRVLVGGR